MTHCQKPLNFSYIHGFLLNCTEIMNLFCISYILLNACNYVYISLIFCIHLSPTGAWHQALLADSINTSRVTTWSKVLPVTFFNPATEMDTPCTWKELHSLKETVTQLFFPATELVMCHEKSVFCFHGGQYMIHKNRKLSSHREHVSPFVLRIWSSPTVAKLEAYFSYLYCNIS